MICPAHSVSPKGRSHNPCPKSPKNASLCVEETPDRDASNSQNSTSHYNNAPHCNAIPPLSSKKHITYKKHLSPSSLCLLASFRPIQLSLASPF